MHDDDRSAAFGPADHNVVDSSSRLIKSEEGRRPVLAILRRSLEHSAVAGGGRLSAAEAVGMMQMQQLRRRSCWGTWIATGAILGGLVVGALAFVLCRLDTEAGAADYASVVAIIAGILGAVGGGIAGTVCAVLAALLDRWTGGLNATGYAVVAASVTAIVTVAFGGWLLQPDSGLQGDQLWGWVLIAIPISSAVAAVAGWFLWRDTFDY